MNVKWSWVNERLRLLESQDRCGCRPTPRVGRRGEVAQCARTGYSHIGGDVSNRVATGRGESCTPRRRAACDDFVVISRWTRTGGNKAELVRSGACEIGCRGRISDVADNSAGA